MLLSNDPREWPTSPLDPPEIRAAVLAAIRCRSVSGHSIQVAELVNPESLAIYVEMPGRERTEFGRANRGTFEPIANAFVNHLMRLGVIEPWHPEGGTRVVVPEGREADLISEIAVNRRSFVLLIERIDDKRLRKRLDPLALGGAEADLIAEAAVKEVEHRIREKTGVADRSVSRQDLAAIALRSKGGRLKYASRADEQQGVMLMCQGFFLGMGNHAHHAVFDLSSAALGQLLAVADYLLAVVEASEFVGEPTENN